MAPLTELRVPFRVDRTAVDDVDRGSQDSDWQPVKDAARLIAFAEDRAIFEGYPAAQIPGIRAASSNPAMTLPADVLSYPEAIAEALRYLREAGVNGPVLGAAQRGRVHRRQRDAWTTGTRCTSTSSG